MPADDPATSSPPVSADRGPWRPRFSLFAISFLILFFELACIRWFGSTVVFLTFFTNIVLLACVLGMSAGCLAASRRRDYLDAVIPLTLVAVLLAQGMLWGYYHHRVAVSVGDNQASPQQVYFGTESPGLGMLGSRLPIELIAGGFFGLIALMFVGLGQVLGRSFEAVPDRVAAYTTNIAGSLAGIVAFSLVSYARTPPLAWFAVGLVPVLAFLRRRVWLQAVGLALVLLVVGRVLTPNLADVERVSWSPYYKVVYQPEFGTIFTNNIGHQQMLPLGPKGAAYVLPYLMNRDAGGPPRDDVLIVGAGSGNDVQAALSQGARHVDAVEIDPVLYEIGRAGHPDHPYRDPRVSIHLDDGRSFVRKTAARYDQITYALVDSLVLHSGYSSLRLESFLFTEQAFGEIRERLKPQGVFVMYNYYRQGFVIGRLVAMAERAFGTRPIVLSLPYQEKIDPGQSQSGQYTMILVGRTEESLAPIRRRFEAGERFWLNAAPRHNAGVNAFGAGPPTVADTEDKDWLKIGPAAVETRGISRVATDDWPFLYLRSPSIPAFNLRGILIMLAVSAVVLGVCAPWRSVRPNGRMFFLGAGFMLLETKGVVHLALLFGSTWVVNSIVFFAILVMVLLSNLYVLAARPRRLWIYYALLLAALALNIAVPPRTFLALPEGARVVASCAVIFVPVFFAGVIFAAAFRDSTRPEVDLGSNIAGVVLGGLSEYLSLVVGFNGLLLIACAYYVLSAVLAPRGPLVRAGTIPGIGGPG
jgi:SAM-dependent methyltransferase